MSEDISTQLPNPPELQPISSSASKIWRSVSLFLTVGGLALMGVGGWIFIQQQIEANKPPPARILDMSSVPELESAETTQLDASLYEPYEPEPIEDEAPVIAEETTSTSVDTLVSEPDNSPVSNAVLETELEPQKEVVVESEPEVTSRDTTSLAEAKMLEEASLAAETALNPEPTPAESPLSLADNPLPVVEDEEETASAVAEADDSADSALITVKPLTRIVAESIDLDAEVTEVGWESVVQDGVATNVWVVADYAAGWHKNSKLPGQGGNIVMSAHHNIKGEVFRYTRDLEPGDIVTLYDEVQSYDYVVEDKFILKDKGEPEAVRQENAKWIGPFNEERLTLVTCWPYNSNSHRLIVIAKPAGEEQAVTQ